jgi:hypothetical protein
MSAYILHNAEVSGKVEVTAHANGAVTKEKPVAVH